MSATTEPAAQAMPGEAAAIVKADPTKKTLAGLNWNPDYADLVKRTVLQPKKRPATNTELYLFAEQVERTRLDPFLRQIYGIYRFDSQVGDEVMQPQVSIDGFRLVAERTGKYEGQTEQEWCGKDGIWKTVWTEDEHPFAARCGVWKTGRRTPTYAVAHWSEYVQNSPMWKKMGRNQLSKCAEALALRKAFPNELSGLYTPDEMAQADRPGLGDGRGSGEPAGIPLGRDVEAVLARAAKLGHHGIADRGTVEMRIADADGKVIPEKAARFIRESTAELDAMPQDAIVVEPDSGDLSRDTVKVGEDKGEAVNAPQEPVAAGEASESPRPDDPERIEALRRRGSELLSEAEALRDSGDERADEVFEEFERLAAEVESAENMDQGSLPL